VDEINGDLDVKDQIGTYNMDYLAWGRITYGDAYYDLVATDYSSSPYVRIYTGSSDGTLDLFGSFNCGSGTDPDQIALAPMGSAYTDQTWELIIQDYNGGNRYIRVYTNNGSGSFNSTPAQNLDVSLDIEDFCIGDINRDGYYDLVVCGDGYVKTFLNNHNGQFNSSPNNSHDFISPITQIALGQSNSDGFTDILLYRGGCLAEIYYNTGASDPGDFDFTWADWEGWVDIYFYMWFPVEELMFVDLRGCGAYSVAMTGYDYGSEENRYLCVFFDNSNPRPPPVYNVAMDGEPGGHPTIKWSLNDELDMDKYIIYRALMEDTTRPTHDDFDSLTYVSHPTTEYTDTTVLIHTQYDNYKIWYAVTAMDDSSKESDLLEIVTFWGYYEDGQAYRFYQSVSYGQPAEFAVSISPNPFNPRTTFSFDLPEAGLVNLAIYDISGRLLATLVSGYRDAGSHSVDFDGTNLVSGIYIYRLNASSFDATGKIVLMK